MRDIYNILLQRIERKHRMRKYIAALGLVFCLIHSSLGVAASSRYHIAYELRAQSGFFDADEALIFLGEEIVFDHRDTPSYVMEDIADLLDCAGSVVRMRIDVAHDDAVEMFVNIDEQTRTHSCLGNYEKIETHPSVKLGESKMFSFAGGLLLNVQVLKIFD